MEKVVLLTLFALSMILFSVVLYDYLTDKSLSNPEKKTKEDTTNQD